MTITLNGTTGISTPALSNSGALTQTGAATLSSTLQAATTIGVGGATPAASGAGITFPATQSASTDENTLDDYEEGTWTPTLTGASSVSLTLNGSQVYVKVGKLVNLYYDFTVASNSVGSQANLGGFPFLAGGNPAYFGGGFNNFAGGQIGGTNYNMNWLIGASGTSAGGNYSGASSAQVTPANMSTIRFIGQISYRSNS